MYSCDGEASRGLNIAIFITHPYTLANHKIVCKCGGGCDDVVCMLGWRFFDVEWFLDQKPLSYTWIWICCFSTVRTFCKMCKYSLIQFNNFHMHIHDFTSNPLSLSLCPCCDFMQNKLFIISIYVSS